METALDLQMRLAGLPIPEREYRFETTRRWRADRAWPWRMVLLEVEGGTWINGRHSRGSGMRKDCEKYNAAALAGWYVYRVTGDMIRDGSALELMQNVFREVPG